MARHPQNVLAAYADAQNANLFKYSATVLRFLNTQGEIFFQCAYHNWQPISSKKAQKLSIDGWRCIHVPVVAKNEVDRQLMADVRNLRRFREPDILVLITNDGDFSPLVRESIASGKKVIVIGNRGKVSRKLVHLLPNNVYFVEDLNRLYCKAA